MNRSDELMDSAHAALEEFRRLTLSDSPRAWGTGLQGRIAEYGLGAAHDASTYTMPEKMELVDFIIAKLPPRDRKAVRVIFEHWNWSRERQGALAGIRPVVLERLWQNLIHLVASELGGTGLA